MKVLFAALVGVVSAVQLSKPTDEFIQGEFVATLKKELTSAQHQQLGASLKAAQSNSIGKTFKSLFFQNLTVAEAEQMAANTAFASFEHNQVVRVIGEKSDVCAMVHETSWGLSRISHVEFNSVDDQASLDSTWGTGVDTYTLDTGVYCGNVDFNNCEWGSTHVPGSSDEDRHGHGTHCASTTAGIHWGIATGSTVRAVKVLGYNGSGSMQGVINGVEWTAAQHGSRGKASTANMSLGGGKNTALESAVNAAVGEGVVFVVAAGNSNNDACNSSPAGAEDAITVGATQFGTTQDERSSFSSYGTCVNIMAPGSTITAAGISSPTATATMSGTSMASPHVCGVATAILGSNPSYSPDQVKEAMYGDGLKNVIDMKCTNAACEATPNTLLHVHECSVTVA